MMRVGVVCLGNVARSFLAERVFAYHVPEVEWVSAGVTPYRVGGPADRTAREVLRDRGYADGGHMVRGISNRLLESDLLLVTGDIERHTMVALAPPGRVRFVSDFDPLARGEEVANPWGKPRWIFEVVVSLFERCVPELRAEVVPHGG